MLNDIINEYQMHKNREEMKKVIKKTAVLLKEKARKEKELYDNELAISYVHEYWVEYDEFKEYGKYEG